MSRAVCGVCFCPYGDEGDCACTTETHYKKVIDDVQALFDAKREQPAEQDMPKIGCVNHDCDKCKAQQQEPAAIYVGETWCGSVVRLYQDLPLETSLYTSSPTHAQTIKDQETVIHRLQKRYAELEAKVGKPWVGLTEEEFQMIYDMSRTSAEMMEMVETKLQEKNT